MLNDLWLQRGNEFNDVLWHSLIMSKPTPSGNEVGRKLAPERTLQLRGSAAKRAASNKLFENYLVWLTPCRCVVTI